MLTLRLPPELETRLAALARKTGRNKSALARDAIIARIGDLEDSAAAELPREADDGTRYSLKAVHKNRRK